MSDFFWGKEYQLDVCEYDSSSITVSKVHAKKVTIGGLAPLSGKFSFSLFRLSVALAKSVLTRDPTDEDLIKEVRSSLYRLDSMLDSTSSSLRLTSNFRKKYRDFSRTSRMGELAQAAAFVFSQEILRHPLVIDFHGFLRSQRIPDMDPDLRSPDFALMFKGGTDKPSLLESKGSSPDKHTAAVKSKLKEAIDQCLTGEAHIIVHSKPYYRAKNSFGTYLLASEMKDSWPSTMAFCDPENDQETGMSDPISAARYYYASFLILAGDRDVATMLLAGRLTLDMVAQIEQEVIDNTTYSVFRTPRTFNLFTPLLARKKDAPVRELPNKWFLQTNILRAIVSNETAGFLRLMSEISPERLIRRDDPNLIHFSDGTLCRREPPN